ncbi:MAG: DNA (cytosine-5-)-methyltransferase [Clostridia bacterium]|nr:DNA (cytosine-5-)-methyltransferase [Clostridia bacterium]
MQKKICELFAGVGGFRLGLERLRSGWETVWFSQWEPGAKKQWAHECYVSHFGDLPDMNGEYHTGEDIGTVDKADIPDHNLLVGGFPCQDYSVAGLRADSKGIEGKKGVLWWQIIEVLSAKKTPFCLFENVDRLLKSPGKQRGRDFGIMLSCLDSLDYSAEWRVVNAAVYGAAQRRKRVFIFAYRNGTDYARKIENIPAESIISRQGFMARSFPVKEIHGLASTAVPMDLYEISESFLYDFKSAGYMHCGVVYTANVTELGTQAIPLGDILEKHADPKYTVSGERLEKWKYLKGAKKIPRISAGGHEYFYSEGPIAFPDPWDQPGRTILTSEGTMNRSSHVVQDPGFGVLRTLTPVEAERLQGFDDNWTNTGMPERMRFFCMGNALVVPMITMMGRTLDDIFAKEP